MTVLTIALLVTVVVEYTKHIASRSSGNEGSGVVLSSGGFPVTNRPRLPVEKDLPKSDGKREVVPATDGHSIRLKWVTDWPKEALSIEIRNRSDSGAACGHATIKGNVLELPLLEPGEYRFCPPDEVRLLTCDFSVAESTVVPDELLCALFVPVAIEVVELYGSESSFGGVPLPLKFRPARADHTIKALLTTTVKIDRLPAGTSAWLPGVALELVKEGGLEDWAVTQYSHRKRPPADGDTVKFVLSRYVSLRIRVSELQPGDWKQAVASAMESRSPALRRMRDAAQPSKARLYFSAREVAAPHFTPQTLVNEYVDDRSAAATGGVVCELTVRISGLCETGSKDIYLLARPNGKPLAVGMLTEADMSSGSVTVTATASHPGIRIHARRENGKPAVAYGLSIELIVEKRPGMPAAWSCAVVCDRDGKAEAQGIPFIPGAVVRVACDSRFPRALEFQSDDLEISLAASDGAMLELELTIPDVAPFPLTLVVAPALLNRATRKSAGYIVLSQSEGGNCDIGLHVAIGSGCVATRVRGAGNYLILVSFGSHVCTLAVEYDPVNSPYVVVDDNFISVSVVCPQSGIVLPAQLGSQDVWAVGNVPYMELRQMFSGQRVDAGKPKTMLVPRNALELKAWTVIGADGVSGTGDVQTESVGAATRTVGIGPLRGPVDGELRLTLGVSGDEEIFAVVTSRFIERPDGSVQAVTGLGRRVQLAKEAHTIHLPAGRYFVACFQNRNGVPYVIQGQEWQSIVQIEAEKITQLALPAK
ncbi:MAG: hypothetical protein IT464_06170 [Planctomycetes bacterium]|nr:hypothetical protein [Planctomycetota bacterium]